MSYFNIIAQSSESTVVTEYKPQAKRSEAYQSEADLEQEFIRLLCELGYERLTIHKEADLIANLRTQLEKLNNYRFTDGEWKRFWGEVLANTNSGILEKTRLIQEDYVQVLRRDNGESKNIQLIDKKCIHNNSLQVINQYAISTEEGAAHDNRYDVTVLVNGLPLIHIELKRRGVPIREAFNQIDRYQRDSFWASSGLYEFVQIFVISNGTNTKYYSNTTRFNHIKDAKAQKAKKSKTSNSFEFTSFWADANNRIIPDLVDFTKTFFCKHTILNILTRYCVFTAENMLLVMRPYQIVATERILNRIEIANNYKKYGTVAGGGYIWHTTGSGKTLTSFKTAQLATKLNYIDKVLFVVDRKDVYSYLPKSVKAQVDAIMERLAQLPEVAACYDQWWQLKDEIAGYYGQNTPPRQPLTQRKEFRSLKNWIIREAEDISFSPSADSMEPGEKQSTEKTPPIRGSADVQPVGEAVSARHIPANAVMRLLHHMGQIFRTSMPVIPPALRIDSKRRRRLQEKRMALGHKRDDHEDEQLHHVNDNTM